MKMFTNSEQTAKLIELGFEKPKSISGYCQRGPYEYDAETNTKMVVCDDTQYPIYTYSIGELIEMLPSHITHGDRGFISYLSIAPYVQGWKVAYTHIYIMLDSELVDALYYTIVCLKEEGVI